MKQAVNLKIFIDKDGEKVKISSEMKRRCSQEDALNLLEEYIKHERDKRVVDA